MVIYIKKTDKERTQPKIGQHGPMYQSSLARGASYHIDLSVFGSDWVGQEAQKAPSQSGVLCSMFCNESTANSEVYLHYQYINEGRTAFPQPVTAASPASRNTPPASSPSPPLVPVPFPAHNSRLQLTLRTP